MKTWHEVSAIALAIAVPVTAARLSEMPENELRELAADAARIIGAGGEAVVFGPPSPRRGELLLNALATGLAIQLRTLGVARLDGHEWRAW